MIRFLFFTLLFARACTAAAQGMWDRPPKFFFEADIKSGEFNEKLTTSSLTANYPNGLNAVAAKVNFTESNSFAYDLQFGYYFNYARTFGIGTGIFYMTQKGNISTDTFHIEYEATDYKGNVYRQLVSSDGPINESVKISNLTIPLYLRYKKAIIEDLFLTVDGGVLFSLLMQNSYSTNASFDYEAIYKFEGSSSNPGTLYDGAAIPASQDWVITRAQFLKDNPNGDAQAYFSALHSVGYNVGLNEAVNKTGSVSYNNKSIGFMLQPALNYKIRDKIYGKAGFYLMEESFVNQTQNNNTPLTGKMGDYNSLLTYTKSIQSLNYGFLFGINFYF
jgi:hypothetical protein